MNPWIWFQSPINQRLDFLLWSHINELKSCLHLKWQEKMSSSRSPRNGFSPSIISTYLLFPNTLFYTPPTTPLLRKESTNYLLLQQPVYSPSFLNIDTQPTHLIHCGLPQLHLFSINVAFHAVPSPLHLCPPSAVDEDYNISGHPRCATSP